MERERGADGAASNADNEQFEPAAADSNQGGFYEEVLNRHTVPIHRDNEPASAGSAEIREESV